MSPNDVFVVIILAPLDTSKLSRSTAVQHSVLHKHLYALWRTEHHMTKLKQLPPEERLNILLSNGRFPVALDLARQLHRFGHRIFTVDPMRYHVSKFSNAVVKSFHVPAPHYDATGYIDGIRKAAEECKADLIIPLHEEIFYLTKYEDLQKFTFAPGYSSLMTMHNKWEFYLLMKEVGVEVPESHLIQSLDDIKAKLQLDTKEYALKPVFGRAKSNVHHLKPGKSLPDGLDKITRQNAYVAQEWVKGRQTCSYSICLKGRLLTAAVYPVIDSLDGSSSVYFESVEHATIKGTMERVAKELQWTGQMTFDWIDVGGDRMVALECNPRATAGIHLYRETPILSQCFTGTGRSSASTSASTFASSSTSPAAASTNVFTSTSDPAFTRQDAPIRARRQVAPGMLMAPFPRGSTQSQSTRVFLSHLKRLVSTRDVTFSARDLNPAIMQPFLLLSYYEIARERGLEIKEVFQDDVVWEAGQGDWDEVMEMRRDGKRMDEEGGVGEVGRAQLVSAANEKLDKWREEQGGVMGRLMAALI